MQFSSIWPLDRTLSGATTPNQSWAGSDDNQTVLRIPQSSCITGTSLSDCLVSWPGHSLGGEILPLCICAVGIFYNPSQLGKRHLVCQQENLNKNSTFNLCYFQSNKPMRICCLNTHFLKSKVFFSYPIKSLRNKSKASLFTVIIGA